MLIQINGERMITGIVSQAASHLDVADELVSANGHYFNTRFNRCVSTSVLSQELPEDFSGFDIAAFRDCVSTLATQV